MTDPETLLLELVVGWDAESQRRIKACDEHRGRFSLCDNIECHISTAMGAGEICAVCAETGAMIDACKWCAMPPDEQAAAWARERIPPGLDDDIAFDLCDRVHRERQMLDTLRGATEEIGMIAFGDPSQITSKLATVVLKERKEQAS